MIILKWMNELIKKRIVIVIIKFANMDRSLCDQNHSNTVINTEDDICFYDLKKYDKSAKVEPSDALSDKNLVVVTMMMMQMLLLLLNSMMMMTARASLSSPVILRVGHFPGAEKPLTENHLSLPFTPSNPPSICFCHTSYFHNSHLAFHISYLTLSGFSYFHISHFTHAF